ncbi:MAG: hypothetical protein BJ554DRAFT_5067 [Olpidium bornovanus]|uniref:Uncharacterized protein n=1 Tax=Olpidium bornovanus TaxID=278681 RepID=A0A8H7ZLC5_9FUNG|nr:MAG: hypothetical protein BJ554DRAFT_5067 [Olpidium bornovanus]
MRKRNGLQRPWTKHIQAATLLVLLASGAAITGGDPADPGVKDAGFRGHSPDDLKHCTICRVDVATSPHLPSRHTPPSLQQTPHLPALPALRQMRSPDRPSYPLSFPFSFLFFSFPSDTKKNHRCFSAGWEELRGGGVGDGFTFFFFFFFLFGEI